MLKDRIIVIILAIIFALAVLGTFFSRSIVQHCKNNPHYWPEEEKEVMLKPSPTPEQGE